MKFFKNLSLVTRIILGLVIGAGFGILVNATKITYLNFISIFGEVYIGALKAIAPILVFILVVDSLANGSGTKKSSTGITKVIILYLVSSFVASIVAVIISYMFKVELPGLNVAELSTNEIKNTSIYESIKEVILSIISNPINALAEGDYLPILFWASVIGVALKKASIGTKKIISDFSNAITTVMQVVIKFAPLGVMGLIFTAVSTNGTEIFVDYGELIAILVLGMIIVALVVNPLIVFVCLKQNPYPLIFKCLINSGVNAFFTRSSAANIPINMKLCEELKVDKEIYSVTIPLGATINMAGAAVVITIMTLSTAWALNMNISFGYAITMCFIATIAAAGTAGTAGGSLMLIPLACSLFGISADIAWFAVGVGGTIGVIQDSVETLVNSSSDVVLTATADKMLKKDKKLFKNLPNILKKRKK